MNNKVCHNIMGFFTPIVVISKALYRSLVPAQKYELVARLYGHRDSILAVDATRRSNGDLVIASAGRSLPYILQPGTHLFIRQGRDTSLGAAVHDQHPNSRAKAPEARTANISRLGN